MSQCVRLLVFLHGALALLAKGVLGLSDESSDSSPGPRKSYYILQMLPVQRVKGNPENAGAGNTADAPAPGPSRVGGATDTVRPAAGAVACVQLPPAPREPRRDPAAPAPPWTGSAARGGPDPAPPAQAGLPDRQRGASVPRHPGDPGTVAARLPPTPRVLRPPGPPTDGAPRSTGSPAAPAAPEPRGDA
ncbi:uncharacterized protein LOC131820118 [Mustela lutreola]|uniref:uncharacterized protein LOC131820118 n=1 Tax=Mustela lutreola TaxID=9666 RepID=UPI0027970A2B|nr:uncharacterized protein LOC131820118 [Mustela lutreola]